MKVRDADEPAEVLSFDQETGDLLRSESHVEVPGGRLPVDIRHHDYREVAGVRIAHRSRIVKEASGAVIIELTEVESGLAPDPALFAPPAKGGAKEK